MRSDHDEVKAEHGHLRVKRDEDPAGRAADTAASEARISGLEIRATAAYQGVANR